ncbi:MAG: PKD domain-containing protein, partial [Elusimicrobia bacterium]|nr:PKD domain-containing protein [Elusimicrobiota bacterium]
MRFLTLRLFMAAGLVLIFGIQASGETVTIDVSQAVFLDQRLFGDNLPWYNIPSDDVFPPLIRSVCTGSYANAYDWYTHSGATYTVLNALNTLAALREVRNGGGQMMLTVNIRGTGYFPPGKPRYFENFVYSSTDLPPLVTMAGDWVHYTNVTLQAYRRGDAVPAGRDLDVLNRVNWGEGWDELLASGEAQTPKVAYWEIDNEPAEAFNDNPPKKWGSGDEYLRRYQAVVSSMTLVDPSIKVGPMHHWIWEPQPIEYVLKDPSTRIDFVSYHPYDDLGRVWGYPEIMEQGLRGLRLSQKAQFLLMWEDVVKYGRYAPGLEFFATEWNPVRFSYRGAPQQSMFQALAVVENLFTFADVGVNGALFWPGLAMAQSNTVYLYPAYHVMQLMLQRGDDRYIGHYNPGGDVRIYAVRNSRTGETALWAVNFSNTQHKSVDLVLENLGAVSGPVTRRVLKNREGPTSLLTTSWPDDSANSFDVPGDVGWETETVTSFDPSLYAWPLPPASVSVLVIPSNGSTALRAGIPPVAYFTVSQPAPRAVALNASRSFDRDGTVASYSWDFGDGSTASGAQVQHAYAGGGRFLVRLRVTDNSGQTDEEVFSLPVEGEPAGDFIAYWPFDEGAGFTALDVSGNGHRGVIDWPLTTWHEGIRGKALRFNGNITDQVIVQDSPALRLQRFTLSAWIKPDVPIDSMTYTHPGVISKEDWAANAGFRFGAFKADRKMQVRLLQGTSAGQVKQASYVEPAEKGSWIHLAATYDGQDLKLFRNGLVQATNAIGNITINHNAAQLVIGRGFKGLIDEVKIYNRALTEEEIVLLEARTRSDP